MSTKLNRSASVVLLIALISPLIVMAVRSEGYHATKIDLNDAGIWTVNRTLGSIGRVNTQISAIEVALPAKDPQNTFDVSQVDDTVVLQLPGSKQIVPIDVALAKHLDPVSVPDKAVFMMGGPVAAVLDPANGKVWAAPRSALASLVTEGRPAALEAGPSSVMAVGDEGTVFVYAAGKSDIETLPGGGSPGAKVVLPEASARPSITSVGSYPVVLDTASARLLIPGRAPVDLKSSGDNPVLQLPGAANTEVIVATDTSLIAVSLADGSVRTLTTAGTRNPVPPVWLDRCTRGAWRGTPTFAQVCEDRAAQVSPIDGMKAQDALAFRVNRGRVILNDLDNGNNLLFTPDQPEKVNDWQDAMQRDNKQGEANKNTVDRDRSFDCSAGEKAPEAVEDRAGTREGRPVIVRVLANDIVPDCVVPQVTLVPASLPPPEVGVVTVVNGGREIQVAPAGGSDKTIVFSYRATGSTGASEAKVTVEIVADSVNNAPVLAEDTTTVEAGKAIRVNVLDNDTDPDGDALTLTNVNASDGTVTFRAQGDVTYTASGAAVGMKQVAYTVTDGRGGDPVEGKLTVTVISADDAQAPIARADQLNAFVGRDSSINVLTNDDNAHGLPLTLAHIDEPAGLDVKWHESGKVTVHPTTVGSTTLTYQVTDGDKTSSGRLRIDVLEAGENHPPVAVRDDLVARSGVPALSNLVANDIDLDGDVLAVTAAVAPVASGLSVELIDLHLVRVTAPAGFAEPVEVAYTVTDGHASSFGVLVVRPVLVAGIDQGPTAAPDDLNVRAGNVTVAKVLTNDSDPEGDRLKITAAGGRSDTGVDVVGQTPLPAEQGSLFIEGEELRYVAPQVGPATIKTTYTVKDAAGNVADGLLTIHVASADPSQNRPPEPAVVEARVFAGADVTIKVPLIGMDPDGDTVALIGVGEPPVRGDVTVTDEGFLYHAHRGVGGTDTFSFIVRDSLGLEATGIARVAVLAKPETNSDPVAVPDRGVVQVGKSTPIAVLANDSDPDGDPVSLLTTGKDAPTTPTLGTVAVDADGKRLLFTAPPSIAKDQGEQSFSYTVADGRGGSAQGIVTVTITVDPPPNELPIARDDLVKAQRPGSAVDVDVLANDHDPDGDIGQATITVLDQPKAAVVGGKIRVQTADTSVAFAYELTDQRGGKARALVVVPVTQLPPVCDVQTAKVKAGDTLPIDVLRACKDPAGRPLRLQSVGNARGGTVTLDGTGASFAAAAKVDGDAAFTFVVATADATVTAVGAVRIEVTGQDFPPTFDSGTIRVPAGGERTIDLTTRTHDLNAEDKHTFEGLAGATDKIKASIDGSKLKISAADDAKGLSTALSFKVADGNNAVEGHLSVQVDAHDGQPPRAVEDSAETDQKIPVSLDLTANDIDPLRKGLTIEIKNTQGGAATVDDPSGKVTFTPRADFFGIATLTYEISDIAKDPARKSSAQAKIKVYGFPSKVAAPTRASQESGQITLAWAAPPNNGAPIDKYTVRFGAGLSQDCPSTTCVISGLTNGTKYQFTVAAWNRAVKSEADLVFGDPSPEYTPDEIPVVPDVPTLVFGNGQVTVSWKAPPERGTPIKNYYLRARGGPAPLPEKTLTASELSVVWGPLTNGIQYDFQVAAQNSAEGGAGAVPGRTDYSAWTNDAINGVPATSPGIVPNVVATRLDKNTTTGGWVTLQWKKPVDNGDPNLKYHVTVEPPDVGPFNIANAAQLSLPIGGLDSHKAYVFTVAATNKAPGGGLPPVPGPAGRSAAVTPASIPAAMGAVAPTPGDNAVSLSFGAPDDGGSTITRWQIAVVGGASGFFPAAPVPVAVGSQLGVANDATYQFTVSACNEVGCGPASAPSASVTPFGPPLVSAGAYGGTVTWSWPHQNGVSSYTFAGPPGGSQQGDSFVFDAGPGPARSFTLAVTAHGQGVSQAAAPVEKPTHDTRRLTIERGEKKNIESCPEGGTTGASCVWFEIKLRSFLPSTRYLVTCRTDYQSTPHPGGIEFKQFHLTTDASGNANSRNKDAQVDKEGCAYGQANTSVWGTADGLTTPALWFAPPP